MFADPGSTGPPPPPAPRPGTHEGAPPQPRAPGPPPPVDPPSAHLLGRPRSRYLHRGSGPVRQPSLKNARERDGCVVIPIRSRVFPIEFACVARSGRLFAGCAAHRLASNQAVIRATVLQGRRLT